MRNPFAAAAALPTKRATSWGGRGGYRASIFEGGATTRLYSDWDAWTLSPEFEARAQFRILRARARSLARNNPWITGFLDELANNVVGPHGIKLHAQVKTALAQLHKPTNNAIEAGWLEWSNPEYASADGYDSWIELQRQVIQTIAVDGECFVRRIRGADNAFGYTLQIIDADLVDETYNRGAGPNGENRVRMGIEIDRRGRPVFYHVWTSYAEDMTGVPRKREPIPADEVIHLFVRYRPNQPRGITWFVPILTGVRHLDGYELNELVATRAAAAKMGFILNKHPDAVAAYTPPKKGEAPRTFEAEPGSIPELLPGQEFMSFDPSHPSTAYEQFVMAVLRAIARGLRISYLTLTGDLRQANYSSMRAGLLPERDRWRGLQIWLSTRLHRVVYRDWIDMAALKGAVAVDNRLGSDYYDIAWHGRGWKWVDPTNELEAARKEIYLGINSRTRITAEQGRDYEELVDELADEQQYADTAGVDVSGTQGTPEGRAAVEKGEVDPAKLDQSGQPAPADGGTGDGQDGGDGTGSDNTGSTDGGDGGSQRGGAALRLAAI